MSKQRVEVLVIGAGRHQQKIQAAIYKALDGEFSEAAKWRFPDRSGYAELVGTARCLSLQVLSVSIDNDQLSKGAASVEAIQGFTTGYAIDPLESAIELIVRMMDERMASDRSPSLNVGSMLMGHLEELLAEQLRQVTDPDRGATLVGHLNEMTRKLQSLIDVKASTAP